MNTVEQVVDRLKAKQSELMDRLARIRNDRRRAEQPLSADFSEQAVERENDEVLERLDAATEKDLQQTNHALERIKSGSYGRCEKCGGHIEIDRLRAVPEATYCAACAHTLKD